jgi:predicted helicase
MNTCPAVAHLAHRLAHLAHQIRAVVEHTTPHTRQLLAHDLAHTAPLPPLSPAALADTYAQTVVYGLFARAALPSAPLPDIPTPSDARLRSLLAEGHAMLEHANIPALVQPHDTAGPTSDPVLHVYEAFLAAYNPAQRQRHGVYYTPAPVVCWMVRAVDTLLKRHCATPAGLSAERVLLLDPAMGTGTFLHALIRHIHTAHIAHAAPETWSAYVARSLLPRLYGIEMLVAPYIIAGLNLRLLLHQTGYRGDAPLRLALANALRSPWEAALAGGDTLPVILGNPPYAAISANRGAWDEPIRAHYYPHDGTTEQNPKPLLDDYVKFLRYGQWHIEQAGAGILAFVTNHSYLDTVTFRTMRQSLLATFPHAYVLNLHGNARRSGHGPDGQRDENVFAIQQGIAIALFVRPRTAAPARVCYADMWGPRSAKEAQLQRGSIDTLDWQPLAPAAPFWLLVPHDSATQAAYAHGWKLTDIFPLALTGIKTHRDHVAFAFERAALEERIAALRDRSIDDAEIRQRYRLRDTADWRLADARRALSAAPDWQAHIVRCLYRPFDYRYLYYHPAIVGRPRLHLMQHMRGGDNLALLVTRQQSQETRPWALISITDTLTECCALSNKTRENAYLLPLYRAPAEPNLAPAFVAALTRHLGIPFDPRAHDDLPRTVGPADILHYVYAVLHHPAYRERYAAVLRLDFPRVPLPRDVAHLAALAEWGAALVALHRPPHAAPSHPTAAFVGGGDTVVRAVRYTPPADSTPGAVAINAGQAFVGIAPDLWETPVGSYQPLRQWLQQRKGRALAPEEIAHYLRMVAVLHETRRLVNAMAAGSG